MNGQRRDLSAEQRAQIWLFCNKNSEAWQAEQARIAEEANRKRSEAAKAQHEVSNPRAGESKPESLVVVPLGPPPKEPKARLAAIQQAGVNAGALEALSHQSARAGSTPAPAQARQHSRFSPSGYARKLGKTKQYLTQVVAAGD